MAEIFNITHESGGTGEYSSIVDPDTDEFNVTAPAAMADSNYGAAITIDDQDAVYGERTFTQLVNTEYRYRFYIDPDDMSMDSGDVFTCVMLLEGAGLRQQTFLAYDGSNYEIVTGVRNDAGGWENTAAYDITNASHYVEVLVEYAGGNNAAITLWIDGAQQENKTGLDVEDISKPDRGRIGAVGGVDAGTTGVLFVDEWVFRDDNTEIGPASYGAVATGYMTPMTRYWGT